MKLFSLWALLANFEASPNGRVRSYYDQLQKILNRLIEILYGSSLLNLTTNTQSICSCLWHVLKFLGISDPVLRKMCVSKIRQLNVLRWQCTWKNVETHFHTQAHAHTPRTLGRGDGEHYIHIACRNYIIIISSRGTSKKSQIKEKEKKKCYKAKRS